MKRILFLALLLIFTGLSVFAQTESNVKPIRNSHIMPVPFEIFMPVEGLHMQMVLNKKLVPDSRWGMFVLSEYYGDYDRDRREDEFIVQSLLTFDIIRGLALTGGGAINSATGFSPSFGLQFALPFHDFFLLLAPRVEIFNNKAAEILGFLEYKPMFSENWGLYSRVQALYAHSLKNDTHEISYVRFRLGASYKNFQFGLGTNHTAYGPIKFGKNLYGIFARTTLF